MTQRRICGQVQDFPYRGMLTLLHGDQNRPYVVIPHPSVQKLVDISFEHLYGLVTLFGHPTGP